jgi:hypothetical protein
MESMIIVASILYYLFYLKSINNQNVIKYVMNY